MESQKAQALPEAPSRRSRLVAAGIFALITGVAGAVKGAAIYFDRKKAEEACAQSIRAAEGEMETFANTVGSNFDGRLVCGGLPRECYGDRFPRPGVQNPYTCGVVNNAQQRAKSIKDL